VSAAAPEAHPVAIRALREERYEEATPRRRQGELACRLPPFVAMVGVAMDGVAMDGVAHTTAAG